MLKRFVIMVVSLAMAWCAVSSEAADKDRSWTIAPRTLPPPAGASEQLEKILANMGAPSLAPLPTTLDGWRKQIATGNSAQVEIGDPIIKEFNLDVKEEKSAGVRVYRVTPPLIAPEHVNRLFVNLHGGAFIYGNGRASLPEAAQIAAFLKIPVLAIDYRTAPDHPAPAAMDDIVAVWREVLKTHKTANIALGGTSAGGTLTLVATLRMKDLGVPLPAALFVGSPVADFSNRGDTRFINDGIDYITISWKKLVDPLALYAGSKSYDDPYISPIFGNFKGFPPTYLIAGTRDLLLSDTVRAHQKLRQAGVEADLHVYEGIAHAAFRIYQDAPECPQHYAELNAFVSRHLDE